MSEFIIEILEPVTNLLEIETSYGSVTNNIEVQLVDSSNLTIVNTEKVLASDLPDNIPMGKIVGNLDVHRIFGLDDYLDNYEFDCGTP
jgi:hypothetical protein